MEPEHNDHFAGTVVLLTLKNLKLYRILLHVVGFVENVKTKHWLSVNRKPLITPQILKN